MVENGSKVLAKRTPEPAGGFLGALVDRHVTNELAKALPLLRQRLEEGYRAAAVKKIREIRARLEAEFAPRVEVEVQKRLDAERDKREAAFAAAVEEEVKCRLDSFREDLERSSEIQATVSRMAEEAFAALDVSLPNEFLGTTDGSPTARDTRSTHEE